MNDPLSRSQRIRVIAETPAAQKKLSFFERLSSLLLREPEDREQLLDVLHAAHDRHLVDDDALSMMEGVLQVGELAARDIMVQRAQMDMIDVTDPLSSIVPFVVEKAHSRFPVFEGDRDRVIGVLLAKDLLRCFSNGNAHDFDLRSILRPVVFIPESKRLNVLLRDFRANRNHQAIVVDEYGGVSGLITIEDVLEQIVGDIEDEHDFDTDDDTIVLAGDGRWRVRGITSIEDFNERFGTHYEAEDVGTIGGLVMNELGHVPHRGEVVRLGPIRFEVLRADARQLHVLLAEPLPPEATLDES
ncbi:HlyC/CorC family transporter [Derxia gummosa]|uniref:Magnesium and cobalt efflux protein CorC n=1 Tax=Derxia gummosa DSM 723 TaxID=1121388 RepID=A0A8B6X2A6_9BURK|nr:transporter associated domain-containing protein [Derxia gummosa]